MRSEMRIVRIAVVTAASASLVVGLSGCSAIGDLFNQGVDAASSGSISLSGLPTDWPGDVPVIEGTISGGAKVNDGWTALVKSSSQTALTDAQALLENYGFSVQSNITNNGSGIITMVNSHYQVTLTGNSDGVLYVISPAQ